MRVFAVCCAGMVVAFSLAAQDKLPEGPGKAALVKVCQNCHPADIAATKHHTREEWERTVTDMINAGATGTDDEFNEVVEYLVKNFPPLAKVNVNKASSADLVSTLGITSKEAGAIVAYRTKNGDFHAIADLKKVEGLDYAKIEAKKDRVQF